MYIIAELGLDSITKLPDVMSAQDMEIFGEPDYEVKSSPGFATEIIDQNFVFKAEDQDTVGTHTVIFKAFVVGYP